MQLHVFAPYTIGLSSKLVSTMGIQPNEAVCFAVIKDEKDNPSELWIGKETIFSCLQSMSYEMHRGHTRGYDGFSAKLLVYEMNLCPGMYRVDTNPRYCNQTGIDWYRVYITNGKRDWRAIESHPVKKNKRINLENDGDI